MCECMMYMHEIGSRERGGFCSGRLVSMGTTWPVCVIYFR